MIGRIFNEAARNSVSDRGGRIIPAREVSAYETRSLARDIPKEDTMRNYSALIAILKGMATHSEGGYHA